MATIIARTIYGGEGCGHTETEIYNKDKDDALCALIADLLEKGFRRGSDGKYIKQSTHGLCETCMRNIMRT